MYRPSFHNFNGLLTVNKFLFLLKPAFYVNVLHISREIQKPKKKVTLVSDSSAKKEKKTIFLIIYNFYLLYLDKKLRKHLLLYFTRHKYLAPVVQL